MTRNITILSIMVLFLTLTSGLFGAENKYEYDYSDPKSIVTAASKMIFQSDYREMLKITEMSEKKRAQEIVDSLLSNEVTQADLKGEAEKILGFEIVGVEYVTNGNENKLAVVFTKWLMKSDSILPKSHDNGRNPMPKDPTRDPEKQKVRTTTTVFVDYLLKQYNGKWKIVSKRSR